VTQYGSIIAGKDLERYFYLLHAGWEFHALFNDSSEVNERAIAIVGASFLDTQLEHMLINFFVSDEREVQKLLQPERPISTFGSRTTLVYCLGLIGKVIRDDLRLVAKIRNRFAHRLEASFDDEPIRSWCLALKWHEIGMMMKAPEGATTRDIFQVGVNQLISHLSGLVGLARLDRRQIYYTSD
jgi:hypothetical protein